MARLLIATFGSYGDLHPYMAIGIELRNRGHRVVIATSPAYQSKVLSEGLEFHPVRPDVSLTDTALLEYVSDARRGSERVLRYISDCVAETYADTFPAVEAADLVVTHPVTFAAVLAVRKLRKPWISSVLAPDVFLSAIDPPVAAAAPWLIHVRKLGPAAIRFFWNLGRRTTAGWLQAVIRFREHLGLPDTGNPLFEGSHSPELVLALFSATFSGPQPDWPPQTLVTGFPFYDRHHEQQALPPELNRFLAEPRPPVVFTLGSSAVGAAGDFYRHSLRAVEKLGVRALFLTGPFQQGLPDPLPAGVIAVPYAPHSEVFPRASAIVHQGGVGTTAQAMRSGRPMLVVPFAHDQFNNAERVRRLGAAEVVYRSRYNAGRAERALHRLIESPGYAKFAAKIGEQIRAEHGTLNAADAIERSL